MGAAATPRVESLAASSLKFDEVEEELLAFVSPIVPIVVAWSELFRFVELTEEGLVEKEPLLVTVAVEDDDDLVILTLEGGTSFVLVLRSCDDRLEWDDLVIGAVDRCVAVVAVVVISTLLLGPAHDTLETATWEEILAVFDDEEEADCADVACVVWCVVDNFFDMIVQKSLFLLIYKWKKKEMNF
jgi:hypothetical protein